MLTEKVKKKKKNIKPNVSTGACYLLPCYLHIYRKKTKASSFCFAWNLSQLSLPNAQSAKLKILLCFNPFLTSLCLLKSLLGSFGCHDVQESRIGRMPPGYTVTLCSLLSPQKPVFCPTLHSVAPVSISNAVLRPTLMPPIWIPYSLLGGMWQLCLPL